MKFVRGRIWALRLLWALAGAVWIAILSLPALGMLLAVGARVPSISSEYRRELLGRRLSFLLPTHDWPKRAASRSSTMMPTLWRHAGCV